MHASHISLPRGLREEILIKEFHKLKSVQKYLMITAYEKQMKTLSSKTPEVTSFS